MNIDYTVYRPTLREQTVWVTGTGLVIFLIGMVFYKHPVLALGLALIALGSPVWMRRQKRERRRDELVYQFQQALQMLSSSIAAGKSLESSIVDTIDDLQQLFPDPGAMIVHEWRSIVNRMQNGVPIEQAFADLARRSGIEDIQNFAEVLAIGKRQGGNLVEVIRRTVQIMTEKLDIQREIAIQLAKKRWESRLLCAAPIGFVCVLVLLSSDYMAPLYTGVGRLIMTGALVCIAGCWWVSKHLMDIEV